MDVLLFLFVKIGLDLLGFYLKFLLGNKYIVGFVDLFFGWLEVYVVLDKIVVMIVYLIIEEIFFCYGVFMEIIIDNGIENENRIVKDVLEVLNIFYVKILYYYL